MNRPTLIEIFPNTLANIDKIFFCICINDKESLKTYITGLEEGELKKITDCIILIRPRFIKKQKGNKASPDNLIDKQKEDIIDLINVTLGRWPFPLFDMSYSYFKEDGKPYKVKGFCEIKTQYGCETSINPDTIKDLKVLSGGGRNKQARFTKKRRVTRKKSTYRH